MDDMLNIAKPKPLERFAIDVNASVKEVVDSMRAQGENARVAVSADYAGEPLVIDGDRFALGRVYRNLITNAIQATPPDGRVTVTTSRRDGFGRDQRRATPAAASRRSGSWRSSTTS